MVTFERWENGGIQGDVIHQEFPDSHPTMVRLFLCVTFSLRGESLSVIYLSRCLKLRNSGNFLTKTSTKRSIQSDAKKSQIWLLFRCRCSYLGGHTGSVVFYTIQAYSQKSNHHGIQNQMGLRNGLAQRINHHNLICQTSAQEVMILWLSTWHSLWVTPWPKRSIWCFHG